MERQPNPLVPPKACPICSVAMQATETKERIVHRVRKLRDDHHDRAAGDKDQLIVAYGT